MSKEPRVHAGADLTFFSLFFGAKTSTRGARSINYSNSPPSSPPLCPCPSSARTDRDDRDAAANANSCSLPLTRVSLATVAREGSCCSSILTYVNSCPKPRGGRVNKTPWTCSRRSSRSLARRSSSSHYDELLPRARPEDPSGRRIRGGQICRSTIKERLCTHFFEVRGASPRTRHGPLPSPRSPRAPAPGRGGPVVVRGGGMGGRRLPLLRTEPELGWPRARGPGLRVGGAADLGAAAPPPPPPQPPLRVTSGLRLRDSGG
jgi:hypothetical protein